MTPGRVQACTSACTSLGRPRLWLDRVFTIAGAGTVVTGTLASGSLRTGAEVELAPHGRRARIRSIQSHKKRVQEIAPGNRTALNLAGLERTGAERGDAIILPSTYAITDRVDVWLRALPQKLTGYETEISDRGAHLLHVGSAELPVRIKLIGSDLLQNGDEGAAQLYLRSPLPLERGDRFVIRDAGRALTVGGGTVLDPLPPYARKTDAGHVRVLETLRRAHPEEALTALVNEMGEIPVEESRLRTLTDSAPGAIRLGPLLLSSARLDDLTKRLHAALSGYHASNPLERGMPRETARAFTGLPPEAFDAFLALDRQVVAEAATVRLKSHTAALDPVQEKARAELIARIDAAGFTPPFEKELGADAALLRALVAKGDLVKIADFYLTQRQTEAARAKVRAFIAERGPATVAEIRDLLGTSRKYAVPLCEWLDREGITRRKGDKRALGPRA